MNPHDLSERAQKTAQLYADPHNPLLHLERGRIHERLGFPDLAAADAYRALTLLESVVDPDGCEFHARRRVADADADADPNPKPDHGGEDDGNDEEEEDEDDEDGNNFVPTSLEEYDASIGEVYGLLVRGLVRCGCLRDAYEFCVRGMGLPGGKLKDDAVLKAQIKEIKRLFFAVQKKRRGRDGSRGGKEEEDVGFDPSALNVQGYARRVLYPWNEHEPDRKAADTLRLLNERLKDVAPKCEVKAVALPALHNTTTSTSAVDGTKKRDDDGDGEVSIQLGLFAKEDISPGEILLRESSLLTATNRLHDDLCDACNSPLPDLSSENPPVACEGGCDDTIFCSQKCHDRAQEVYHAAVCGQEGLETIGRDIQDPKDKADYLYLLLLGRAIAMAATQEVHPLELPEVKYIWGDFHDLAIDPDADANVPKEEEDFLLQLPWESNPTASLPFSFQLNVLQPMRILEEMGLDPFATLPLYDTWVLNTLYAKFRGTASGRLSTWDGGPEVCAVHPLWCLANHSCDPNVRWEWGGEITFMARSEAERAVWKGKEGRDADDGRRGGIRKGEEILNHYCDIGLDVKERREWARGALGGICLCERCVWEASLEN
ncbi:hypothetical protein VTN00DRAFT_7923 [Thermoascus crustaceus]|uniref:uncharacterized protein n=1 Tax=Thermoascus crustaceus TaxID=5088 RepID=UPI0037436806